MVAGAGLYPVDPGRDCGSLPPPSAVRFSPTGSVNYPQGLSQGRSLKTGLVTAVIVAQTAPKGKSESDLSFLFRRLRQGRKNAPLPGDTSLRSATISARMRSFRALTLLAPAALALAAALPVAAQEASPEAIRFFEQQVRPILHAKCALCHNEQTKMNELSLASRESLLIGGMRGPAATPGNADGSLLVQAIRQSGDLKMPPTGKLSQPEIDALTKWVEMGLPWPEGTVSQAPKAGPGHWSFRPVEKPNVPSVEQSSWVRNPIDNFIVARLEKEGLKPSEGSDRVTLIRRVSLDLVGLLPSLKEVDDFVNDTRPDAYEQLVERLLASPHHGERWGRHWLDIARYADTNGYNLDGDREIWMYRDWVIDALNADMPFDQFTIEQLAGDLLPNPSEQQIVATGFHRNTLLNLEGGIDFEQYRVEAVVDRVDTTGAAFLGLTIGCARCHSHKYDPISHKEFYGMYAFFNNIDELSGAFNDADGRKRAHDPILEFGKPEEFTRRDTVRHQIEILEKEREEYGKSIEGKQAEWEASLSAEQISKMGPRVQEVLAVPIADRNEEQQRAAMGAFQGADAGWSARSAGIAALRKAEPKLQSTLVMRELPEPREAYIHEGGDFLRKGATVEPGTLSVLPPLEAKGRPTRLDFARWLVDAKNPLTPRVTVNRMWQRYFGRGIVRTENDFGSQGAPPTHPELLDWLASEFVAGGWSSKAMHRLIVNSATYRQSSMLRPELIEIDPDNQLLARQSRLRLEAEIIRDAALSASGLLSPELGGPSVYPPQPEGAGRVTQIDRKWKADTGPNRFRRGIYTYFWRSAPHPGLMVFDGPDSMMACTRRNRSNTPLQALTLLNDQAHIEFAQALAQRVLDEAPASREQQLDHAFRLSLGRLPKAVEREQLTAFLAAQLDQFQTHPEEAAAALPMPPAEGADRPLLAAWTSTSRVLLNLDEFITRE